MRNTIRDFDNPSGIPTLLANSAATALVSSPVFDQFWDENEHDQIPSVLERAAKDCGITYLFEIPATLMSDTSSICCVVNYGTKENGGFGFVVCNPEQRTIQTMTLDEIPEKALRFFQSYYEVLSRLGSLQASPKLN